MYSSTEQKKKPTKRVKNKAEDSDFDIQYWSDTEKESLINEYVPKEKGFYCD